MSNSATMPRDDRAGDAPTRRRRMAIARFWHEGNAFTPFPTDKDAFDRYEWRCGKEALEAARGTATELGGVVRFAQAHPSWRVVALRCASALPSGPINDSVFESFLQDLTDGIVSGADEVWDAVYVSLHGAAITKSRFTPEVEILRRVRDLLPGVPIGASFDLHGNMPPEIAGLVDVASAYRTHPHVDMAETALRVLEGVRRCAEDGLVTQRILLNERIILPSFNMRTQCGPMRRLEELASAEEKGAILDASIFGGFPYSDTPMTGSAVFVTSDANKDVDGSKAKSAAERLMSKVRELAPEFSVSLPTAEQAVAQALGLKDHGLVAVTDPADNPLSGGTGDTPTLLRALIDARAAAPSLFAAIADPGLVDKAIAHGIGTRVDIQLGGRFGGHFGLPVQVSAVIEKITNGRFRNVGPMERGIWRDCGGSVLLRLVEQPSIKIIVTRQVTACDDPAFFDLHDVDLQALRLLCVKAKNHFRAAFASRCVLIIDCDAPGPAMADLTGLPFRYALRPQVCFSSVQKEIRDLP